MDIKKALEPAIRQYKHNDGSGGFVFAYDKDEVERIIPQLLDKAVQDAEDRQQRLEEEYN